MPIYTLSPFCEPSLWTGPRRPTQAEIDAVLVEHFRGRARTTVLEMYRDGRLLAEVAHEDYEPASDPSELTAAEGN